MQCRLCGGEAAHLGILRPYLDYTTAVYACSRCNARMARHDPSIHSRLHAGARSSYAWQKDFAHSAADYFARGDLKGLGELLDTAPKNRLVMGALRELPARSNVLEVGCSRGYLTAYAVLCGHNVLGVDVSQDAIDGARALFGDHFVLIGDPRIAANAPYGLIYHVGTIGCVEDPVSMLRSQLELLRSGGTLVFNAPDVQAAMQRSRLWSVSTTPPDLVTLFDRNWFAQEFSPLAEVEVSVANEDPVVSMRRALGRERVAPENSPHFRLLEDASATGAPVSPQKTSAARALARRLVGTLDAVRLVPRYAHEFGILVRLTKR